jgi:UDP-glucose 4-epimerase
VTTQLLNVGHQVVVLDNLSHGYLEAVPPAAVFVKGEVGDRENISAILGEHSIEAVMHFAGLIEAGESMLHPERYFRNNTAATLALLEAMVRQNVKRLVFSSTAAVYEEPTDAPLREEDPLSPANPYGESKLLAERMLKWFHRIHGLHYACLRYFNAAGAHGEQGESHQPESHLIPLVLQVALGKRSSVQIYGGDYPTRDGTCIRDYIHVADLASAHVLSLGALDQSSELIYNLGNGRGFTVREVIDVARRVTGHAIPAETVERRPGDAAVLIANSEKIQRELKWAPAHADLETIIGSAWVWQRAHPNGYESAGLNNRAEITSTSGG